MLRIWMFGALSVAHGDEPAQAVAVPGRSGSLLAYLALGRGRYFSRNDLLEVLWPERLRSIGAGTFNTALWRLRRIVETPPLRHGELIASDRRGAVGMVAPDQVWLDTEHFERLLAPGLSRPIEALGDEEIRDLHAGVSMYTADILTEYDDDWALRQREKLRRHYLNALWRLMQVAAIRRDWARSIAHAQGILDCDALREDVHRELMRLYVLSGQRAQALRQFETCRDLLRRELAIPPMRETLNLYRQIADSALSADGADPYARGMQAPLPMDPLPPPPDAPAHAGQAGQVDDGLAHAGPGHGDGPFATGLRNPPRPAVLPRDAIAAARRCLADADRQLELGLQALD